MLKFRQNKPPARSISNGVSSRPSTLHCLRIPRSAGSAFRSTASARYGGFSVKAMSPAVLVEKTESGKVERVKSAYLERIIPLLKKEFNYANIDQVPKNKKIVVNCGIGDAAQNSKGLEAAMNDFALITGQRPSETRAKKAIATFKIRENQPLE